MLQFPKESEAQIETFRSALRAERLHMKLSAKSSNFFEILAKSVRDLQKPEKGVLLLIQGLCKSLKGFS